jgi:hypothetical protein
MQAPPTGQQPQFNFSNGPANPGNSVVFRGAGPAIWISTDPARDLVSVNGLGTLDPSQSFVCGGAEWFDIIEFQNAVTSRGLRLNAVVQNPTQHIYAGIANFFSQASFCDALSLPRVAEGIGDHLKLNDNCNGGGCDQNAATGSLRARGTLADLVNGGQMRYTEAQHFVFNFKTGEVKWVAQNIRLTSIGTP